MKACSSFIFSFFLQCRHNLTATLPQPCSNLATTLQQGCNSFNSMVFATSWQPCSKVVVDNLATGLQQGCSKLVTLVWVACNKPVTRIYGSKLIVGQKMYYNNEYMWVAIQLIIIVWLD